MTASAVAPLEPPWGAGDSLGRVEQAAAGRGRIRVLSDGSLLLTCVNPTHEDRVPSLHATWTATQYGGRTLLHCPACGDSITQDEWAELLGLEYDDLFDDRRWTLHHRSSPTRSQATRHVGAALSKLGPLPARISDAVGELLGNPAPLPEREAQVEHEHDYEPVLSYPYRDDSGAVVQQVLRLQCTAEGCSAKTFRQSYLAASGQWVWREPAAFTPRLYRSNEVDRAVRQGLPVWVMEGEKDADTGARLGLVTTTNARGGAHFPLGLAEQFAGADVRVVLDRDDTGWARGIALHQAFTGADAAAVRLLLPATNEPKSDFSDHINAGHDVDALIEVPVEAVRAWAGLRVVNRLIARVDEADSEATAQLKVAQHDKKAGRKAKAVDRERFARRWAHEASRLMVQVQDAAEAVHVSAAAVSDCAWAQEAAAIAQSRLDAAGAIARSTHEQVQLPLPDHLSQRVVLADRVTTQSAAPQTSDPATPTTSPALRIVHGDGRGGGPTWIPGVHIQRTEYRCLNGQIVEVKRVPVGKGEETVWEDKFVLVINRVILIVRKEAAEDDEDLERHGAGLDDLGDREGRDQGERITPLPKITHVIVEIIDPNGESEIVRVRADDFDNGNWLSNLPIAGLDFSRTRSGRDRVSSAVNQISDNWQVVTSYRGTGWRTMPDGRQLFITADGAIGPDGYEAIATNLTGPLARYTWPNPTTDQQRIRTAFLQHSAGLMDKFPDRVGATLLGTAFRAMERPNEWVTVLTGAPGTGKTGLAALVMHHFGELHDRNKPLTSMSGNGGTMNAIRWVAYQAMDVLCFFDDVAPTAGHDQATRRIEEFVRMISNSEARLRAERDGQGVQNGTAPRTSGLITSELRPRAGTSGERRMLIVPLDKDQIDIDEIRALDHPESRHGRALLGSSYLQWMAAHRDQAHHRAIALRDEYLQRIKTSPSHPSSWDRHSAKVAELWAGWGLLLDFLGDIGALNDLECQQWRSRVDAALLQAAEACEDPDLISSTGQRVRDLVQYALAAGLAHVADIQTGGCPVEVGRALGWRPTTGGSGALEWRTENRSLPMGWVNTENDEIVCPRMMLEAVLKTAASDMVDNITLDLGTVLRAMEEEDLIKVARKSEGAATVRTLARTVACQPDVRNPDKPMRAKMVVLKLGRVLGGEDPDEQPPLTADANPDPSPMPPTADPEQTSSSAADVLPIDDVATDPTPDPGQQPSVATATNCSGVTLPVVIEEAATACRACGYPANTSVDQITIHRSCFSQTTATTREQLKYELASLAEQAAGWSSDPFETPTQEHPHEPATPPPSAPLVEPASTPATQRRRTQTVAPAMFAASAAVVDVDAAWLPDGTLIELPEPVHHLGQLEELGRRLNLGCAPMKWRTHPEAGLVVPTRALWQHLGIDLSQMPELPSKRRDWMLTISKDLPALRDAVQDGWVFGRGDADPVLRGLTRLRRSDAARGQVAVLFTPGTAPEWGLDSEDLEPARLAKRLDAFAAAVGIPFRGSPISTGLDLLQIVLPRKVREALIPANAVDYSGIGPAAAADLEAQFNWTRTPMSTEQTGWLALYDRGGSYLSTWSSLRLGYGPPEHLEGDQVQFDAKRAGWWQVRLPKDSSTGGHYPNLLDPDGRRGGQDVWLTTPVIDYAINDLGLDVEILQAWAWPSDRSVLALKGLYEVLRDALTQLRDAGDEDSAAAATLVKQIYKTLSGHFVSQDSDPRGKAMTNRSAGALDMHHPYWYHAMRGAARRAIVHQILKIGEATGRWPLVASNNDLIGYHTDNPDLVASWPGEPSKLGAGLGQYKPARWAAIPTQAQYLTGTGWGGLRYTTTVLEGLPQQGDG